ncbi:MAG: NfeD family protein [Myxococcales bacterium]|nr:NfeD family protein [Myxococcales bacterium]
MLGKYALFQLPGLALVAALAWWAHHSWGLALPWAIAAVVGWAAKDAFLFPFVRHAYAISGGREATPEPGTTVTAREDVSPNGYVRVGAELWRAELRPGAKPLRAGECGTIHSVRGLTVIIEPSEPSAPGD